ncbi:MAG: hypothetical protein HYW23_00510 [Candidatus Aenigmarchaeota archaeon]|nr:hypothetical protein [Candidatus Aenigmarchaeota archaeon]
MDKIIKVLELIENEPKTWKEIRDYCEKIDFDHQHAWDILTDKKAPLVIEQSINLGGNNIVSKIQT